MPSCHASRGGHTYVLDGASGVSDFYTWNDNNFITYAPITLVGENWTLGSNDNFTGTSLGSDNSGVSDGYWGANFGWDASRVPEPITLSLFWRAGSCGRNSNSPPQEIVGLTTIIRREEKRRPTRRRFLFRVSWLPNCGDPAWLKTARPITSDEFAAPSPIIFFKRTTAGAVMRAYFCSRISQCWSASRICHIHRAVNVFDVFWPSLVPGIR